MRSVHAYSGAILKIPHKTVYLIPTAQSDLRYHVWLLLCDSSVT